MRALPIYPRECKEKKKKSHPPRRDFRGWQSFQVSKSKFQSRTTLQKSQPVTDGPSCSMLIFLQSPGTPLQTPQRPLKLSPPSPQHPPRPLHCPSSWRTGVRPNKTHISIEHLVGGVSFPERHTACIHVASVPVEGLTRNHTRHKP